MQQENEQAAEFQDHDTRTWASFGRLASRWERTSGLDQEEMLNELLQGYLRGEIWPAILPNLYGGHEILTASPARPYWMKTTRRFPIETFTRLDFLRAAKAYGHLHVDAEDSPFAAGYRGLIGVPLDRYAPFFIETYIKKLTPSPNAVVRWCSDHGWPVPPGLSCSETDVSAAGQEDHARSQKHRTDDANETTTATETTGQIRREDAQPDQQRKTVAKPRGRGGRKQGSGAYTAQDHVLCEKMKRLLDHEDAVSIWDAAGRFADEAPGSGTFNSKRSRLAKGYSGWISTQ